MNYYQNCFKPILLGCGFAYGYMFGLAFIWESGLGPMTLGERLAHKINPKIESKIDPTTHSQE